MLKKLIRYFDSYGGDINIVIIGLGIAILCLLIILVLLLLEKNPAKTVVPHVVLDYKKVLKSTTTINYVEPQPINVPVHSGDTVNIIEDAVDNDKTELLV